MSHAVWILGHDGFVDAHAGVVVYVTRLGKADYGVDEYISLALTSSANSKFPMSPMHRVASLECDDPVPREFLKVSAQLSRGIWRKRQTS